ncbi:hypothetical protein [Clostridium sp.]|uniref:hypothetical protein n=1 Tax=Clostridium sp. TaxID=1506 RepID=UPI0039EA2C1B
MCQFLIIDIFIACIGIFFITFILPFLIWNLGNKGYVVETEVLNSYNIKPISSNNKNNIYVKESSIDNKKEYMINVNGSLQNYDAASIEIEENNYYANSPKYEEVNSYKVYELTGSNIIAKSVNDIYVDVYLDKGKSTFLYKKIHICIPENSIDNSIN